jgi:AraC family transcriptional regulator
MNDYPERLARTLGWIEENLANPITLSGIAGVACFSTFHFTRVFAATTGETVFAYLRKRRLSRAFDEVLGSDRTIIDIALDYQYESAAAFSRAFSKQFRISPSRLRARRRRAIYGYYPPLTAERLAHRMQGGTTMDAKIVKKGPIELVGLRCSNTARRNGIPKLWNRFLRHARQVAGLLDRGTYGVYIYDFSTPLGEVDEEMPFDYLAAGEVATGGAERELPAGFEPWTLPERTYAVFQHRGKLAELGRTYEYIYGVWFAKSDRESAAAEHFEYHGPDFRGDFPDSVTEIWIPIQD